VNDEQLDAGDERKRLDTLLKAYEVVHNEKMLNSRVLMTRSTFFLLLNGGIFAALPQLLAPKATQQAFLVPVLGFLAAYVNLLWARVTARDRHYTTYSVQTLGRLEKSINDEVAETRPEKVSLDYFVDMPAQATRLNKTRQPDLEIFPSVEGCLRRCCIRWLARRSIELSFVRLALVFTAVWTLLTIGSIIWFYLFVRTG